MTKLTSLHLHGWRQFDDVKLDFHDRLTILTGINGTGKTTLLQVLSGAFGYNYNFLASRIENKEGGFEYFGVKPNDKSVPKNGNLANNTNNFNYIGFLKNDLNIYLDIYYNYVKQTHQGSLLLHLGNNENQKSGLYIAVESRSVSNYQQIQSLTSKVDPSLIFEEYKNLKLNSDNGQASNKFFSLKNTLVAWAAFGEGNKYIPQNKTALNMFEGYIELLRKILPEYIGFKTLQVRMPEVVIETQTGSFLMDAASSGLKAVFEICWMIHLFAFEKEEFTVLLDEPEEFLHVHMQREIMPKLLKAFPKAQFIIATHSPFVTTSVKECSVYRLFYPPTESNLPSDLAGAVQCELISPQDLDGTIDEAAREGFGLASTAPAWVEEKLIHFVTKYSAKEMTPADVESLKKDLEGTGLAQYFSQSIDLIK